MIVRKIYLATIITTILLIVSSTNAFAYLENPDTQPEAELDYFAPLHEKDRNIQTLALNLQKVKYADDFVSVYGGWTVTRAWGDMTWHDVHSNCDAWGIGPCGLIRLRLMGMNFLGYDDGDIIELSLDMSGAVIVWNKDFPTGGDFYDFMWRVGPRLSFLIGENTALNVGYKVMHVSNGQWEWDGLKTSGEATKHNPSWNAKGFTLTIEIYFE